MRKFNNKIYLLCTRCVCYDSTYIFHAKKSFLQCTERNICIHSKFLTKLSVSPRLAAIVLITVQQPRLHNSALGTGYDNPKICTPDYNKPRVNLLTLSNLWTTTYKRRFWTAFRVLHILKELYRAPTPNPVNFLTLVKFFVRSAKTGRRFFILKG